MKLWPRWVILSGSLIAALICYLIGSQAGIGLFLGLGLLFELVFWFKLFHK